MSQSGAAGSTVYFLHTIWYCLHVLNILQHALDRFSAAWEKYRGRLLCLSSNPMQCMRQVSGNTLQQVEKFKYLGVVFTSGGRRSEEIDIRVGKANAVLREFYWSVVRKRELSNTAKLSVFKSVVVPILTYGHAFWVMTERISTQVQAPNMGFLRRVHGVTEGLTEVRLRPGQETSLALPYSNLRSFGSKCSALKKKLATSAGTFWRLPVIRRPRYATGVTLPDKLCSCEIRRALNVETLLRIERTQPR